MHRKVLETLINGTAKDLCVWGRMLGGRRHVEEIIRSHHNLFRQ